MIIKNSSYLIIWLSQTSITLFRRRKFYRWVFPRWRD